MEQALDSFFGLKKHHRLMERDIESASTLLKEFTENRGALKQMGKEGVFIQSNLFALQYCALDQIKKKYYCNILKVARTPGYVQLSTIAAWVEKFAKRHNGIPGWILISILEPKGLVHKHSDRGLYFAMRDRYHFVLQSNGSEMMSGGSNVTYHEGEVWWFNNRVPHTAFNESDQERIHIIFDLLPNSMFGRFKNVLLWVYWGLRPNRLWSYYFGRKFPNF